MKKKSETFACEMSQDFFFTKNAKTCVFAHNAAYVLLQSVNIYYNAFGLLKARFFFPLFFITIFLYNYTDILKL